MSTIGYDDGVLVDRLRNCDNKPSNIINPYNELLCGDCYDNLPDNIRLTITGSSTLTCIERDIGLYASRKFFYDNLVGIYTLSKYGSCSWRLLSPDAYIYYRQYDNDDCTGDYYDVDQSPAYFLIFHNPVTPYEYPQYWYDSKYTLSNSVELKFVDVILPDGLSWPNSRNLNDCWLLERQDDGTYLYNDADWYIEWDPSTSQTNGSIVVYDKNEDLFFDGTGIDSVYYFHPPYGWKYLNGEANEGYCILYPHTITYLYPSLDIGHIYTEDCDTRLTHLEYTNCIDSTETSFKLCATDNEAVDHITFNGTIKVEAL